MRRTFLLIGLLIAVITNQAYCEEPVRFPDPNLNAAVEQELGVSNPTPTDMLALTELYASDLRITNLNGLEYATNLTALDLSINEIRDISALAGLTNLTGLDLGNNQISDIFALNGLTNLMVLDLSINKIRDMSALDGLTILTDLSLGNNQIGEISVLSGLTNLERLDLSDNQIDNISALDGLTNLKELYLRNNQIGNISTLAGLTNLMRLELGDNQIGNISVLSGLTNLMELYLGSNQISNIYALARLTNLMGLELGDNQIGDISALAGLTNLTELYLWSNQISNISALAGLTNLIGLELGDNQIGDISALAGLTNLTELYLWSNQISNISALSGLTNLTILNLVFNPLNQEACDIYIPQILRNNPRIDLRSSCGEQSPDYQILAHLTLSDGIVYDLYGKPKPDREVVFPCGPEGLENFASLYLTYAGQSESIPCDQVMRSQLPSELAALITRQYTVQFPVHRFQKDGDTIYAYSNNLGTKIAFWNQGRADRAERYYHYLVDSIAMRDLPLDHAYVEMSSKTGNFFVQQLNPEDLGMLGSAIRALKKAYGLDEGIWSGAMDLGDLDPDSDSDIVELLEQLNEEQSPGNELSVFSTLIILRKFAERHSDLAGKISAMDHYSDVFGMISENSYDTNEKIMAEMLLRSYLLTREDARARLILFRSAYGHARASYEPDLDPAIDDAIKKLEESVDSELQTAKDHLTVFFSNASLESAVQYLNELNKASNGGLKKIISKIAIGAASMIKESAGTEFEKAYNGSGGATAVADRIIQIIGLIEERWEFEREFSAIISLQEIIRRYKHEKLSDLGGDIPDALKYVENSRAQDCELYLALRACDSILHNYKPEWDLQAQMKSLASGLANAPKTEGWSAVGPVVNFADEILKEIAEWHYSEELEFVKSIFVGIRDELSRQYVMKETSALFIAALCEAEAAPELPHFNSPDESSFNILPIPDQQISVGETMLIQVQLSGVDSEETVEILYSGLVSGTGGIISYTAVAEDVGSHVIYVTASINDDNILETDFNVAIVEPSMELIGINTVDFGEISINGDSTIDAFTVTNKGSGTLYVAISAGNSFEIVSSDFLSLTDSEDSIVTVKFAPSEIKDYNQIITFTSNGGEATRSLIGKGKSTTNKPIAVIDSISPNPAQPPDNIISFHGTGISNDSEIIEWEWSSKLTGLLSLDEDFEQSSYNMTVGSHEITFRVKDNDGEWSSPDTATLVINNALPTATINDAPVEPMIPLNSFSIILSENENDENGLSIMARKLNLFGNEEFLSESGKGYILAPIESGYYSISYQVQDNEGTWSEPSVTTIIVLDLNNPPPVLQAIGNKSVDESATLTFNVNAFEPNGEEITYSAMSLPGGAILDSQTGDFFWTPSYSQAGSYSVTFRASDGNSYDSETITITVNNVNRDPVLGGNR